MKMELIQPFINAADAVLSQGLKSPMVVGNLAMEREAYRRKGVAAVVQLTGDIEGRVIFDLAPKTAAELASHFAGTELPETDDLVREAVCELANQVIGNAVATLNDQGSTSAYILPSFTPLTMVQRAPKTQRRWCCALRPPAAMCS